jgi:hypothetical protein
MEIADKEVILKPENSVARKLSDINRSTRSGFLYYWSHRQEAFKIEFGVEYSEEAAIRAFNRQQSIRINVADIYLSEPEKCAV